MYICNINYIQSMYIFYSFQSSFNIVTFLIFLGGRGYINHKKKVRSFKRSSKVKIKRGITPIMPRK